MNRELGPNGAAEEFALWIKQGEGDFPDGIRVEGYSAHQIKELAPFMNGCGVYSFMVNLREDPKTAHGYIAKGFPVYQGLGIVIFLGDGFLRFD